MKFRAFRDPGVPHWLASMLQALLMALASEGPRYGTSSEGKTWANWLSQTSAHLEGRRLTEARKITG